MPNACLRLHLPLCLAQPLRRATDSGWLRVAEHGVASTLCLLALPCALPVAPQVLKPYQVEGVKWLASAMVRGGGLLTDEPGLGKTLQVIALVEAMVKAGLAVWCVKCIHVCVLDV